MPRKEQTVTRFVRFFEVDDSTGCWIWNGSASKSRLGYGRIRHQGRLECAHRLSYQWYIGEIAEGMNVLHTCDNSMCVNPEHLYLGSQSDNVRDAMVRGRKFMPPEMVMGIKKRIDDGGRTSVIAREFGVTDPVVSRMRHGHSYRHILRSEDEHPG